MTINDILLIFLDARGEVEGWLELAGARVVARGAALEGLPGLVDPNTGRSLPVAAIVRGEAVSLHWLEFPAGLAPAQAIAAARLLAADVSAQPVADMHVAVGPEVADSPVRAVALVPALAMAGWIGKLQAEGLDPDFILPEPLLLPVPQEGFTRYDRGELPLWRGQGDAFAAEPELAELVTCGAPVRQLAHDAFEAHLAPALAALPVNLRQGAFAKRRRWKIEWPLVRRLAGLAALLLLATLALQVMTIFRYTFEADRLEAETQALRRAAGPVTPAQARIGPGYSGLASALFGAVSATPNAELTAMIYDQAGALRATVQADSPVTLETLRQRIEESGFTVELGPLRAGGGRPTAELTVRTA
jgi:general secretion pathway protein L